MKIKLNLEDWQSEIEKLQKTFRPRRINIYKPPQSEENFPELIVTVPNSWPTIILAPLYDVHIGSMEHDSALFQKHVEWIAKTPNVLTWNGGDFRETGTKDSQGGSVYGNKISPMEQVYKEMEALARIQHKVMFALSGNHEDRVFNSTGHDLSRMVADDMKYPYFPDYCFCLIKWRGQNFRLAAHHGSGAAQTPGAQLNSARKDLPWLNADMVWTGHLHQKRADVIFRTDYAQKTHRMYERDTLIRRVCRQEKNAPGVRGLAVAKLHDDGRIDASLHAQGKRL